MELHLELWEVHLALRALGALPYTEVAATIARIQAQVEAQDDAAPD